MPNLGDSTAIYIGTQAASAVYVGTTKVWPTAAPSTPPAYIQGQSGTGTTTSPTVTFASPLQTGDVVYFYTFSAAPSTALNATGPTGWVNVLGAVTTRVASDNNAAFGHYHIVTAGENGTTTSTITAMFTAANTVAWLAVVLRGVNTTTPLDGAGSTFDSNNLATPHILAAIPGTGGQLGNNSLVVRAVSKDVPPGTYTTPAGHTMRLTWETPVSPAWLGTRDAATTANTDVTAVNITPSVGDEYVSISVAFAAV